MHNSDMSNKKISILIIDDEVQLEKIYVTFLNRLNSEIDFFDHPQKGWKAIDNKEYDLIITDLKMPIISGDEFIGIVRSSRLNSHTPIILSSAHIDRPVMAELSRQSKVYFLSKPFESQALLDLVSKVLGVKSKQGKLNHDLWDSWKLALIKNLKSQAIDVVSDQEIDHWEQSNVESILAQYALVSDEGCLNISILLKTKTFLDIAGNRQGTHYNDLEGESFLVWEQLLSKCFKATTPVSFSKVIGHEFMTLSSHKKPLWQLSTSLGEFVVFRI